jgi:hypothetical protein
MGRISLFRPFSVLFSLFFWFFRFFSPSTFCFTFSFGRFSPGSEYVFPWLFFRIHFNFCHDRFVLSFKYVQIFLLVTVFGHFLILF